MFTRVLTELERKRVKAYLKTDGERSPAIRHLASRANKHLPPDRRDIRLLRDLLAAYERGKTK
jgi:hypothetical protein